MKPNYILLFFFAFTQNYTSQNFTWVKGSSTGSIAGVYGFQGFAASVNNPGSRQGSTTWTDAAGNLWLFGGRGYPAGNSAGWLNDLWKYDPTTNQWTWKSGSNTTSATGAYGTQGVTSPMNEPGAREFAKGWTDASGNFWLYGGDGFANNSTFGRLADLWKYDPATNQWTWMNGSNTINTQGVYGTQNVAASTNMPGARYLPATWADFNGNFWLFGGRGYAASGQGQLNDLWKYDPLANEWTWVTGGNTANTPGVYGSLGVPSATNFPGARDGASNFTTLTGNLVVFGGQGFGAGPVAGLLNDLWEYDINTNEWTWINGTNSISQVGNYGTQGVPSATTQPGGRMGAASWTDLMGNYWLFGGQGFATNTVTSLQNDVWMFNIQTNQWAWMKGSSLANQNGTYGTVGVSATANIPGARNYTSCWPVNGSSTLWLFGGQGYDASSNSSGSMNDLWKLPLPCNPDSVKAVSPLAICSGDTVVLQAYNQLPSFVAWFNSPNTNIAQAVGSTFTTPPLTASGSESIYSYYVGILSCALTPMSVVNITVYPLPQLSVAGPASVCPTQTALLTGNGAVTYTWSGIVQSPTLLITGGSGTSQFTLNGTGANGCKADTVFTIGALPVPTLSVVSNRRPSCVNDPVTLTANGAISFTWNATEINSMVTVSPSITTTYSIEGTGANGCTALSTFTQFVAYCVGVREEKFSGRSVSVYPNPNTGSFQLTTEERGTLILYNTLGQKIKEIELSDGSHFIESSLEKGVYSFLFQVESKTVSGGKILVD